jgi:hypothetical protein
LWGGGVFLQVRKASLSPSLSRWRRWEEPCGCWATWTDRLVFFRSELVFFFCNSSPVFFALVVFASSPLCFCNGFGRCFIASVGW